MKRYLIIFAVLLPLCCACHSQNERHSRVDQLIEQIHHPSPGRVLVISHRGDWRNYPENSIPAIESVIRMGVDMVEIDIALTKDSVLVLCHDQTLDRTTTGRGRVCNWQSSDIRRLRLKRAHGIATDSLRMPTLKEALEVCKDRILVNVDHGYDYYDLVMEITEELGMTDQVLIKGSRSLAQVKEDQSRYSANMMYMPVINLDKPQGLALLKEYERSGEEPLAYELSWRKMTPENRELIRQVAAGGTNLWVNTLWASLCGGLDDDRALEDAEEIYGQVLDLGTTMIQTDRPELLLDYLRSKGLHE